MAILHTRLKMMSRSKGSTVDGLAYRSGTELKCLRTGLTFDRSYKDVQRVELLLPKDAPQWARDLQSLIARDRQAGVQQLSQLAESYEKRCDSQVYREYEFSLPRELNDAQCMELAREFVQDQLCGLGMTALLNFHMDVDDKTGLRKPHCHAVLLTRRLTATGLHTHKELAWNDRALGKQWREQLAAYTNFYLAKHGFEARVDPRTYVEQGIDLEPQPKLGKKAIQREAQQQKTDNKTARSKSRQSKDFNHNPAIDQPCTTDKGLAFQAAKLRNLYRITKSPQAVFDIVTKHHVTFMWGEVEAILARYIDDPVLYHRINTQLQASPELVLLRERAISAASKVDSIPIYTTRRMLKREQRLVNSAEQLSQQSSHSVSDETVQQVIAAWDQRLSQHGGLSVDQKTVLQHMARADQLSYIVGYAGAGKTTVLEAAQQCWQAADYAVYGLAPTGRAAQNLDQCGIKSQTVDKFLLDYQQGRNQFKPQSVLVLDEAGMVSVERLEQLLTAVQRLGVKLVGVGDGAQLQAVDSGAAFRLVTERIAHAKLETVVRQKQPWQQQATQLFGQLKTTAAIERYQQQGCIELVKEQVASLEQLLAHNDYQGMVNLYNTSRRVAGMIYHDMNRDLATKYSLEDNVWQFASSHPDYQLFRHWQAQRQACSEAILEHVGACRPYLRQQGVDPVSLIKHSYGQMPTADAVRLAERWQLPALDAGVPKHQCDIRANTRNQLITAWQQSLQQHEDQSHIILTYTNRDTEKLNAAARTIRQQAGHLQGPEYTFTIITEQRNDFDDIKTVETQRSFAVGDRLIFLRNDKGLGVKNGHLGTIVALTQHNIKVELDDDKGQQRVVSFAPKLYGYFDLGWATTIHKAQGITVDRCFFLATHETYRNLAYVAMTRHRQSLQVFGSQLDFWRYDKLPQVLATIQDKLSSFDYLDISGALQAMQPENPKLQQAWEAVGQRLQAFKIVSNQAWQQLGDYFTGNQRPVYIPEIQGVISEEERSRLMFSEHEIPDCLKQEQAYYQASVDAVMAHQAQQKQAQRAEVYAHSPDIATASMQQPAPASHVAEMQTAAAAHTPIDSVTINHYQYSGATSLAPSFLSDDRTTANTFTPGSHPDSRSQPDVKPGVALLPAIKRQTQPTPVLPTAVTDLQVIQAQSVEHNPDQQPQAQSHTDRQVKADDKTLKGMNQAEPSELQLSASSQPTIDTQLPMSSQSGIEVSNGDQAVKDVHQSGYALSHLSASSVTPPVVETAASMEQSVLAATAPVNPQAHELEFTDKPVVTEFHFKNSNRFPASSPAKRRYQSSLSYNIDTILRHINEHDITTLAQGYAASNIKNPKMRRHGQDIRFGSGGLVINTQTGLWYNHYAGHGGSIFDLVAELEGLSKGAAIKWLGEYINAPKDIYIDAAEVERRHQAALQERQREQQEKLTKGIQKTTRIHNSSRPIAGTLGERYLRQHRGISADLSADIRFIANWQDFETKQQYPALISFARNADGVMTSCQTILLDQQTGTKAQDITTVKRTHGALKGSAVCIQAGDGVSYIVEGLETALSLKTAGLQGEILVSYGQSNLRNAPASNTQVVVCGDYDGANQEQTRQHMAKTVAHLKERGYQVKVVWPAFEGEQKCDFNDILQQNGVSAIQQLLKEQLPDVVNFKDDMVKGWSLSQAPPQTVSSPDSISHNSTALSITAGQQTAELKATAQPATPPALEPSQQQAVAQESVYLGPVDSPRSLPQAKVPIDLKAERYLELFQTYNGLVNRPDGRNILKLRVEFEARRFDSLIENYSEQMSEATPSHIMQAALRHAKVEGRFYQEHIVKTNIVPDFDALFYMQAVRLIADQQQQLPPQVATLTTQLAPHDLKDAQIAAIANNCQSLIAESGCPPDANHIDAMVRGVQLLDDKGIQADKYGDQANYKMLMRRVSHALEFRSGLAPTMFAELKAHANAESNQRILTTEQRQQEITRALEKEQDKALQFSL